jgi:hypothetical protein
MKSNEQEIIFPHPLGGIHMITQVGCSNFSDSKFKLMVTQTLKYISKYF